MGTFYDMKQRLEGLRLKGLDSRWREKVERTRKFIFELGYAVNSEAVERVLAATSLVPTRVCSSDHAFRISSHISQNTFLNRFHDIFNFTSMFVVDLLHEFELGVWKATFTHLLRILYAAGGDAIQQLNKRHFHFSLDKCFRLTYFPRYRQVPTFGRDTIRLFRENASAMKKLAARDYEDLLQVSMKAPAIRLSSWSWQCAIPVFEDLLPSPHNEVALDLLFTLATWHAYAKLRLHTSTTLNKLETATKQLGTILRRFAQTTCEAYDTRELPQEAAARGRRQAAMAAKEGPSAQPKQLASGSNRRKFNLNTYKLHALGDYANTIREFGTTDNYTTQVVCPSPQLTIGVYLTRTRQRANSSTDGSNVSMEGPTSSNLSARSLSINVASGSSRESDSDLTKDDCQNQAYL